MSDRKAVTNSWVCETDTGLRIVVREITTFRSYYSMHDGYEREIELMKELVTDGEQHAYRTEVPGMFRVAATLNGTDYYHMVIAVPGTGSTEAPP